MPGSPIPYCHVFVAPLPATRVINGTVNPPTEKNQQNLPFCPLLFRELLTDPGLFFNLFCSLRLDRLSPDDALLLLPTFYSLADLVGVGSCQWPSLALAN